MVVRDLGLVLGVGLVLSGTPPLLKPACRGDTSDPLRCSEDCNHHGETFIARIGFMRKATSRNDMVEMFFLLFTFVPRQLIDEDVL